MLIARQCVRILYWQINFKMAAGDSVEALTPAHMPVDLFDVLKTNLIGSRIKLDLDFMLFITIQDDGFLSTALYKSSHP